MSVSICRALGEHFAHYEWPVAALPTRLGAQHATAVRDLKSALGMLAGAGEGPALRASYLELGTRG